MIYRLRETFTYTPPPGLFGRPNFTTIFPGLIDGDVLKQEIGVEKMARLVGIGVLIPQGKDEA